MLTALAAAPVYFHGPGAGFPFFFLIPRLLDRRPDRRARAAVRRGARRRWAMYGGPAFGPHRSPEATLSERFANGEIDEVEYRSRLEVLRANRPVRR